MSTFCIFFFFNDTATTEIYTLSLHDALPIYGRGWVALAMVIFGRWQVGRAVLGALIFAAVYALQLRLQIVPGWDAVPYELLIALPYVAVIVTLAFAGRNVAYPGAYLRPYRRA